jgi:hypothetical protein
MIRRTWMALFTLGLGVCPAYAQMLHPTPAPTVTAEEAPWYLNGEPITYAGNLYYPSGPQVFFNPNEMVRSGFYDGIPLYTRTTIEPFSKVYVPLRGGRLQPYERPRAGELTGTAGSSPTTLPTPPGTVPPGGLALQAAAPPSGTTTSVDVQWPRPMVSAPVATVGAPGDGRPVAATGSPRPPHVSIGGKPQGAKAMFIEFDGRRWYPAGKATEVDLSGMARGGEYFGFTVFVSNRSKDEIYIPSVRDGSLVVRYTPHRR